MPRPCQECVMGSQRSSGEINKVMITLSSLVRSANFTSVCWIPAARIQFLEIQAVSDSLSPLQRLAANVPLLFTPFAFCLGAS